MMSVSPLSGDLHIEVALNHAVRQMLGSRERMELPPPVHVVALSADAS